MRDWYSFMIAKCNSPIPAIFLYLRCSPRVAHQRMLERGREEEKNIALAQLVEVHKLYEYWLNDPASMHEMSYRPPAAETIIQEEPLGSIYRTSKLGEMLQGTGRVIIVDADLDFPLVWRHVENFLKANIQIIT